MTSGSRRWRPHDAPLCGNIQVALCAGRHIREEDAPAALTQKVSNRNGFRGPANYLIHGFPIVVNNAKTYGQVIRCSQCDTDLVVPGCLIVTCRALAELCPNPIEEVLNPNHRCLTWSLAQNSP
jgi:hypothetical protein